MAVCPQYQIDSRDIPCQRLILLGVCVTEEHDGILVLDSEAPVGALLPEVLRVGDRALEFGITPNRGDATSLLGIAREVHALIGGEPTPPETAPPETGAPAAEAVSVAIAATEDCHHYAARVVRGVGFKNQSLYKVKLNYPENPNRPEVFMIERDVAAFEESYECIERVSRTVFACDYINRSIKLGYHNAQLLIRRSQSGIPYEK